MFDGIFMPSHLLILGLVALLVFGPKRLPEMGRALGSGLREFKESVAGHGVGGELKDSLAEVKEAVVPTASDEPRTPKPNR